MASLLAIVWDWNPTLVDIGSLDIRYYGVMWAVALLLGGWIFSYFCKHEGKSGELADSAFVYIALGTIIGARVGHCLFYDPLYYLSQPWTIITEIRDGGMASHGATIGILLSIWLCARKNRVPVLWLTDRLAIIAPISGAIIRLGNLFNSEIIGRATDAAWGFKFVRLYPNIPIDKIPAQHPTQLYEAACYVLTFVVLWYLYKRTDAPKRYGMLFGISLIGIFLTRFFIEFIKMEQEKFEVAMIDDIGLNMGQVLSLPFIIIGIVSIWYAVKHPPVEAQAPTPKSKAKK
ncbi:MAG: prolipoprotein diacylglyceryl transferase [Alistipes sp.]